MKDDGQTTRETEKIGSRLEVRGVSAGDLFDCWNKIGVYGEGTCVELAEFIHCRNCPVYSKGGRQLLDRSPPTGYQHEWTEHFAREKHVAAPAKASGLLFRIGNEWLALPTQAFQEVAERRAIHSLPHRRQGIVLGLANVRGELVICVSLGRLLGIDKDAARQTLRTIYDRLLVIHWDGQRLAFPVDEVQGTYRFELRELKPPPATVSESSQTYSQGILHWKSHAVGYLEAERLFSALNRSLT